MVDRSGAGGPYSITTLFPANFETKGLESDTRAVPNGRRLLPSRLCVSSYGGKVDKIKKKKGSVFVANDVHRIGFQLSLLLSNA